MSLGYIPRVQHDIIGGAPPGSDLVIQKCILGRIAGLGFFESPPQEPCGDRLLGGNIVFHGVGFDEIDVAGIFECNAKFVMPES